MLGTLLVSLAFASDLQAGGDGLNTVVVVNQYSSNSCELGNYYCERREIPPDNVLRIYWAGGNISWTSNDFQSFLLTPLTAMVAARQLTNQIDYVVLSMDVPFQTTFDTAVNSTTSALFYGLKPGGANDPGVANSYAASEASFHDTKPATAPAVSFLATMITGNSLAAAKQLVDQGVAGDGTQPLQPVMLAKSSDPARNMRYLSFDDAIFNVNVLGVSSLKRTNSDSLWGQTNLLGYETGLDRFDLSPGTFVGGAIADSLTSYGGILFGPNSQTNLLACIQAGAAGSYGTVAEPGTDPQKFPDPRVYFYQARGFSLAECYYQSIDAPVYGLTVADPLSAPFARKGTATWSTNVINSLVTSTSLLSIRFVAPLGNRLQQVDLFVDGRYHSTLTNLAPAAGNVLDLVLNGYPLSYTIPTNATLGSVAAALADLINAQDSTNATDIKAIVHGDRIELQLFATNNASLPFYVADTFSSNSSGNAYQVSYLPDSSPPRMAPLGPDKNGVFQMNVELPTAMPYVVLASTNLEDWLPIFTNASAGLLDFRDPDSTNYPARFYRMAWADPGRPPKLSAPAIGGDGSFQVHVDSVPGLPCAILTSTNLLDWTPVWTNQAGGAMDFVDADATNASTRFYRAWLSPSAPPAFTVLNGSGANLVRVDSATRPYAVSVSTNATQWTALSTNFAVGEIQTSAASAIGSAGLLSTFLTASRSRFLDSEAFGRQEYVVPATSPAVGAWLQFGFTTTNGTYLVAGVTNLGGATSADLAAQLCAVVNTNPALLGSDGVIAEDFVVDPVGTAKFNLRARSPGLGAAAIQVRPKRYGLVIAPTTKGALTQNLADLEPRNHLYVTAGVSSLNLAFTLETTNLADGYHELTAVAYEGSHVRTQTSAAVPVRIQNSSLSATLTLLDVPDPAPPRGRRFPRRNRTPARGGRRCRRRGAD